MVDLILLLQQASAEEAEGWTGERQGKGEKVPHDVRALHTWTYAGSTETRNVDPEPEPVEEGKKGDRTINEDPLDGGPGMDRKISWKRSRKKKISFLGSVAEDAKENDHVIPLFP